MLHTLSYLEKALALAGRMPSTDNSEKRSQERFLFWGTVTLSVLSAALMLTGVGLYIAKFYEPYLALVIVGLITLFLLLAVASVYQFIKYCRHKRTYKAIKSFESHVKQYLAEAGDKADETFQDNVSLIAVMVAVMGYVVAKKL